MRALIDQIEALVHQEVGRNVGALFAAAQGGLFAAATAIAAVEKPRLGILTGFFVPAGTPPAAETDGPAGMALLVHGLVQAGLDCRVLTDAACETACAAALAGAGLRDVPLDVGTAETVVSTWRAAGIDWVVSIERCGQSADGVPRNMRGEDIGAHATLLDPIFTAGPWRTVGIGDGGNEVGMGSLPPGLIAAHVKHGAAIACVTPADHLVMAGVSHWGAYALLAALAVLRPDWRSGLLQALDPVTDQAVLEALVTHGPAVDGVTLRRELTIDGVGMAVHHGKLEAIRAIATGADFD